MKKPPQLLGLLALMVSISSTWADIAITSDTANFETSAGNAIGNTIAAGTVYDNAGNAFSGNSTPWTIVDGTGTKLPTQNLQNTIMPAAYGYAGTNLASLGKFTNVKGKSFTQSVDFLYTAIGISGIVDYANVGLSASGTYANFYGGGYYAQYVLFAGSNAGAGETTGNLLISSTSTTGGGVLAYTASGLAPTIGDKYTLSLTGIYVGTDLTLSLSLTDDTTGFTSSLLSTSIANAATGSYFGLVDTATGTYGTSSATVNFDNYSIAIVPEPSSWLLLGMGLCVIASWSRRTVGSRAV